MLDSLMKHQVITLWKETNFTYTLAGEYYNLCYSNFRYCLNATKKKKHCEQHDT